jgi:hypothetical protein
MVVGQKYTGTISNTSYGIGTKSLEEFLEKIRGEFSVLFTSDEKLSRQDTEVTNFHLTTATDKYDCDVLEFEVTYSYIHSEEDEKARVEKRSLEQLGAERTIENLLFRFPTLKRKFQETIKNLEKPLEVE